jgi:hypothetical protein
MREGRRGSWSLEVAVAYEVREFSALIVRSPALMRILSHRSVGASEKQVIGSVDGAQGMPTDSAK